MFKDGQYLSPEASALCVMIYSSQRMQQTCEISRYNLLAWNTTRMVSTGIV